MSHQPAAPPYTDVGEYTTGSGARRGLLDPPPTYWWKAAARPLHASSNLASTPTPDLAPWERGVSIEHSGSVPAAQAETLPLPPDFDAIYHPGETIEPTPSPVQAATVRAASQGGALTEAEMVAVLTEAGWPAELHAAALAVSWCESRWSPHGAGDISNHPEQMGRALSRGLFQMGVSGYRWVNGAWTWWNGWFLYFGIDEALADDPVTNAAVALWAYQRSGWAPWSCKP